MTIEKLEKIGFNKLTKDNMVDYIKANCPDDMKAFMRASYVFYTSKQVFDENGNAVLTKSRISKKTGRPTKPRVKQERIAITLDDNADEYKAKMSAGEKPSFDLMKSKFWFCNKYCKNLLPAKKTPEKVDALLDEFESLLMD